eukprot:TRINITY_DN32607_c0_g1_i1.p1 TRINITY_DN32607_c0_g1~~TRINITY_DN32607_c0_g1_i1.p1  ORF type:complete len:546 (+),score=178.55 TRINITY_DN32607_c0_g1_i1:70-1707(+)
MPPGDRRAVRPPPRKQDRRAKKGEEESVSPARAAVVGVGAFCICATLYWSVGTDSVTDYDRWLTSKNIRRARVNVVCGTDAAVGAPEGSCGLTVAKPLNVGDTAVRFSLDHIVDAHRLLNTTLSSLAYDGGVERAPWFAKLKELGQAPLWQSFVLTFWMWSEKKAGDASPVQPWLSSLPRDPETPLEWSGEDVGCLDTLAAQEVSSATKALEAFSAAAVPACEDAADLPACAEPFTETADWRWAYHTLRQRQWGTGTSPSLLPITDLSLQHPGLCAGSGPCNKAHRENLVPRVASGEKHLELLAAVPLELGDRLYTIPVERAPWSVLALWGYPDHASDWMPDIDLQYHLASNVKIDTSSLHADHPLAPCGDSQELAFLSSGTPRRKLRMCHLGLEMAKELPGLLEGKWDKQTKSKVSQLRKAARVRFDYASWRALESSARSMAETLSTEPSKACAASTSQRSRRAVETRKIAAAMATAAVEHCTRRSTELLARLKKEDAAPAGSDSPAAGSAEGLTKADLLARAMAAEANGRTLDPKEMDDLLQS